MTQNEAKRIAEDVASDIIVDVCRRVQQHPEVRRVFAVKLMNELNDAYDALVKGLEVYLMEA